ncbi:MAG: hypothetical protein OEX97_07370, partial [Acidimicrobiia bacterium]|nr:hypothetical protein [Acidimicrobiia bacterium]
MTDWSDLDIWWHQELANDPAYRAEVRPLFLELLDVRPGELILDLGTGTGWVLEELARRGGRGIGMEVNRTLAMAASQLGPTIIGALPDLSWCREAALDGVTAV